MPHFEITRRRRPVAHRPGTRVGCGADRGNPARCLHDSPALRQICKIDGKGCLHVPHQNLIVVNRYHSISIQAWESCEVLGFAYEESKLLARGGAANVVTELVSMPCSLVYID